MVTVEGTVDIEVGTGDEYVFSLGEKLGQLKSLYLINYGSTACDYEINFLDKAKNSGTLQQLAKNSLRVDADSGAIEFVKLYGPCNVGLRFYETRP